MLELVQCMNCVLHNGKAQKKALHESCKMQSVEGSTSTSEELGHPLSCARL